MGVLDARGMKRSGSVLDERGYVAPTQDYYGVNSEIDWFIT